MSNQQMTDVINMAEASGASLEQQLSILVASGFLSKEDAERWVDYATTNKEMITKIDNIALLYIDGEITAAEAVEEFRRIKEQINAHSL